jgi:hypothetical protein
MGSSQCVFKGIFKGAKQMTKCLTSINFSFLFYCFIFCNSFIFNLQSLAGPSIDEIDRKFRNSPDNKMIESKIKWNAFALKHNQELFEFQLFSSKILFGLVIFIIIFGLILSGLQFLKKDLPDEKATSLEIGMSGVKISSDILGLLILTISLAFFYIYLNNVYPVNFDKSVKLEETK